MTRKNDIEKKLERVGDRLWKETKLGTVRLYKWLFFYRPKDNMDAFLHIMAVLAWIYLGVYVVSK